MGNGIYRMIPTTWIKLIILRNQVAWSISELQLLRSSRVIVMSIQRCRVAAPSSASEVVTYFCLVIPQVPLF